MLRGCSKCINMDILASHMINMEKFTVRTQRCRQAACVVIMAKRTHTLFTIAIAREDRYILCNDTLNFCDYTVLLVDELSMNTSGMILTRQY
jgi:hypothetical protein